MTGHLTGVVSKKHFDSMCLEFKRVRWGKATAAKLRSVLRNGRQGAAENEKLTVGDIFGEWTSDDFCVERGEQGR